ncbi:gephyrin-like molybdotransferase Glp [Cellulosimicrobium arenosum]|uniref:Molybdopterin molybdenumtransferase n=1 Tax=Cellulosimicrobium arenosum TaxID=2708133 RepID=A0A927G771_9MICO|nr:gephyrin-like molybdotransferase Glp [Cellulosimicrobium arenosum]MBD8078196.1 molybdopterin molybdotransferase MoeA [Cellulosimicrobium arenosum]
MATTLDEHRADVEALLAPLARREVTGLAEAAGRVLAADVAALAPVPAFRNAQMDGFAVRAADTADGATLRVVAEVPAGARDVAALVPGTAARIMTGAPVPDGADAVVPVERTSVGAFSAGVRPPEVSCEPTVEPGQHVREAGSDVGAGDVVVPAGSLLTPTRLAACAATGVGRVEVWARPHVAVVSTGAELAVPGEPLAPGQVYDANATALAAAVALAGGELVVQARTGDEPGDLERVLADAAGRADLVLTSGGVSQGAYEVVKDVLGERGVRFRSVAMQPGGPQGWGTFAGTPLVAFPGNPVSAQVSFVVLVRDALRRAVGLPPAPRGRLALAVPVASPPGRRQLLRGVRDGARVRPVGGAGSHLVVTMARADVLIDVPQDVTALAEGDEVEVWEL